MVDGYDGEGLLYGIPAVREFYTEIHWIWSCWRYFVDLQSSTTVQYLSFREEEVDAAILGI